MSEGGEKRDSDLPPSESPDQSESQAKSIFGETMLNDDLNEGSLNFTPAEHITQVRNAVDVAVEAMRDSDSLNSKPHPEEISDRGRARRVKVGNGFLSFDPASHFEGTDELFARMEARLAALKADEASPEAAQPYVSPQGTVLQCFMTDEQAGEQVEAGKELAAKALALVEATSSASTNLPTRMTEQDMDAAMRVKAALAKKYPDLAVRPNNTTEDTLTRLTDALKNSK